MNICLVSREYPTDDHVGGIGTYTEKTARALASLGLTVDVITEARAEPSTRVEDGVTVHRLRPTRARLLRALVRSRAVAREIESLPEPPDIVQACEFRAEAFWYSFRKPARTKLVTRLATPSFLVRKLNGRSARLSALRHAYIDWPERIQTARSDGIISITHALARVVCDTWGLPETRMAVVKTGVDFSRRYAGRSTALPAELSGCEYLLFFGRLEERKGVHILAQAMPDILAAHPQLHIVFAGNSVLFNGEPMQSFVERCNLAFIDRLHFFQRLPHEALHSLLANALFAVLPSLWEGMGNVSLEALDMGKAVVATRHSGFEEVIEDERSGLLVEPSDVAELKGAILALLDDRALLHRLSVGARSRAETFELTRVTRDLIAFYQSLLTAPGQRRHGVTDLRDQSAEVLGDQYVGTARSQRM